MDRLYKIVGIGTENKTPKDRKQYARDISDIISFFEYELGEEHMFFGGDKLSLTDLMIWPLFERLPMLAAILYPTEDMDVLAHHRKMSKWIENMDTVSSVKKYKLEPEKLAKFYKEFAYNREITNFDSTFEILTMESSNQEDTCPGRQ